MNNKITNPLLKQLISEIANKANEGRITGINWGVIDEAKKKKKKLKKEADDAGSLPPLGGEDETNKQTSPLPEDPPAKDTQVAGLGDVNPTEQTPEAGTDKEAAGAEEPAAEPEAAPASEEPAGEEDVDKAKEDATKAKAELEKAKAEKEQTEKEIEQTKVKLSSKTGLNFLLKKILKDALEKNTVDAFATELSDKLKIKTTDDFQRFSDEMIPYKNTLGMAQLLSSLKSIATETPEKPDQPEEK
jgi:type II secretory ATPase GspE/PulE/Tfp pilus assembly ATPase PilB-like protein